MDIIDTHLHYSNINIFKLTAQQRSHVEYSSAGLMQEFEEAGVVLGIAMGVTETLEGKFPDSNAPNPMEVDLELRLPECLVRCLGINPFRLQREQNRELSRIEYKLQQDCVVGMKIYTGYYPFYVYDPVYEPIYGLAKTYQMPVVIHCGDTYSIDSLLKYAHPLTLDELAVKHRDVTFVIAHMGDPWVIETAELAYKNPNVFVDMSGLIIGNEPDVERVLQEPLLVDHFRRALVYTDDYTKYLFGTDWPLVKIRPYVRFIQSLIPEKHQECVFYRNALRVFPKIHDRLKEISWMPQSS